MSYIIKLASTVETFGSLSPGTTFEPVGIESPWLWVKVSDTEARLVSGNVSRLMDADLQVRVGILLKGER